MNADKTCVVKLHRCKVSFFDYEHIIRHKKFQPVNLFSDHYCRTGSHCRTVIFPILMNFESQPGFPDFQTAKGVTIRNMTVDQRMKLIFCHPSVINTGNLKNCLTSLIRCYMAIYFTESKNFAWGCHFCTPFRYSGFQVQI